MELIYEKIGPEDSADMSFVWQEKYGFVKLEDEMWLMGGCTG